MQSPEDQGEERMMRLLQQQKSSIYFWMPGQKSIEIKKKIKV